MILLTCPFCVYETKTNIYIFQVKNIKVKSTKNMYSKYIK